MYGFGHNFSFNIVGNHIHAMGFIMSKSKRLTYAFKDDMELYFQNASKASANMVEFAIRSIFTMEFRNPSVQVPSMVTYLGTSFDVY